MIATEPDKYARSVYLNYYCRQSLDGGCSELQPASEKDTIRESVRYSSTGTLKRDCYRIGTDFNQACLNGSILQEQKIS
jgi:hypothetical protein